MVQHLPPITPEKVLELFREAWPDHNRHPDLGPCYSIATAMNTVQSQGVKIPKWPPLLGSVEAAKHARLFLKCLPAAREKLEVLDFRQAPDFGSYSVDSLPVEFREIMELIDKMVAVERDVRALLDARHPFHGPRNPARFIAEWVRDAWIRTGERSPPRSEGRPEQRLGEDDPLCVFVTRALAAIGHNFRPSYVSDMLRDRHHRPRSGKARRKA
jgi:hypothetical protein